MNQLIPARVYSPELPVLVATSGEQASLRLLEFFASNIHNRHTRLAYSSAVREFLA